VDFWTSREPREVLHSHVNYVVPDTRRWEQSAAYFIDTHSAVGAFVKNAGLGFAIPYLYNGQMHDYMPDFLLRLKDGVTVILEVKGYMRPEDAAKVQAAQRWVDAVNNCGRMGRWSFLVCRDPNRLPYELRKLIEAPGAPSSADQPPSRKLEQAASFVKAQFGLDESWQRINKSIWRYFEEHHGRPLRLSDIDRIALDLSVIPEDVLAVLTLFSLSKKQLLERRFISTSDPDSKPSELKEEAIEKIRDWWKRKSMSDEEWKEWASGVLVEWLPARDDRADIKS
jgi:hypothetical protein